MVRLRLDISYDGGGFHGWATQPGLRTVQGEIEAALGLVTRQHLSLTVAGRTDAGVHATGQVAHLDISSSALESLARDDRPGHEVLRSRLAGLLARSTGRALAAPGGARVSSDVVVKKISPAPEGFDARFSALNRTYHYRIADVQSGHCPLQRHRTTWETRALDAEAMNRAAAAMIGLADFAGYCKPREGATTVRQLQHFSWQRQADGVIVGTVRADAFCHSMVRALTGACIAVGVGRKPEHWPAELLNIAGRSGEVTVAPARGLTLVEVAYPAPEALAQRAAQARSRREPIEGGAQVGVSVEKHEPLL